MDFSLRFIWFFFFNGVLSVFHYFIHYTSFTPKILRINLYFLLLSIMNCFKDLAWTWYFGFSTRHLSTVISMGYVLLAHEMSLEAQLSTIRFLDFSGTVHQFFFSFLYANSLLSSTYVFHP